MIGAGDKVSKAITIAGWIIGAVFLSVYWWVHT